MAGSLCIFLSGANTGPTIILHLCLVSLNVGKNQDLRLFKHAMPMECVFSWHSG